IAGSTSPTASVRWTATSSASSESSRCGTPISAGSRAPTRRAVPAGCRGWRRAAAGYPRAAEAGRAESVPLRASSGRTGDGARVRQRRDAVRFMMFVMGNTDYEAGKPPRPEVMEAVAALAEKGMREGTLIEQGGLLPSSAGALVRAAGGKIRIVDGPFAE